MDGARAPATTGVRRNRADNFATQENNTVARGASKSHGWRARYADICAIRRKRCAEAHPMESAIQSRFTSRRGDRYGQIEAARCNASRARGIHAPAPLLLRRASGSPARSPARDAVSVLADRHAASRCPRRGCTIPLSAPVWVRCTARRHAVATARRRRRSPPPRGYICVGLDRGSEVARCGQDDTARCEPRGLRVLSRCARTLAIRSRRLSGRDDGPCCNTTQSQGCDSIGAKRRCCR